MNNEVFESLLSRVLDRDLSPREFAELEQHLTESPEARARYMEYVDLHAVLDLELQKAPPEQLVTSTVIDAKHSIRRQKIRSRRIALLFVAAWDNNTGGTTYNLFDGETLLTAETPMLETQARRSILQEVPLVVTTPALLRIYVLCLRCRMHLLLGLRCAC